jgi:hypothetical protein
MGSHRSDFNWSSKAYLNLPYFGVIGINMKELMFHEFKKDSFPEDWLLETVNHSFNHSFLRTGSNTVFKIPLPGFAWHKVRVEIEIKPIKQCVIECGDNLCRVRLEVNGNNNSCQQILTEHVLLAQQIKKVPPQCNTQKIIFNFEDGAASGYVDKIELISTINSDYCPLTKSFSLSFKEDCQVYNIRVLGDKPYNQSLFSVTKNVNKDFHLEVNVDFVDDLCINKVAFTKQMFDDLFAEFKSWGVHRVHWIYYGGEKNGLWDNWTEYALKTIENVGDIFKTAVQAAHKHDISIYGLIKPFEMGFQSSYPENSNLAKTKGRVDRIGGPVGVVTNFVAEHPEFLTARKAGNFGKAINKVFNRIDLVKEDDLQCDFSVHDIILYVSDDNCVYRRYEEKIIREEIVENYSVYVHTSSGAKKAAKNCKSRIMRLSKLNISNKYLALKVENKTESFSNTLLNMVHVYGDCGEETNFTFGCMKRLGVENKNFEHIGVEFDRFPGTPTASKPGCDVAKDRFTFDIKDGFIAIARGKERSPLAILSPAFSQTREWWLTWVQDILDAGADGVELRGCNHHSDFTWFEYGFEEPVVDEFLKRYGIDLRTTDDFDREKFRRLRGEYYTQFFREAKQLIHLHGKKLGLHFTITECLEPKQIAKMEMHWDWRLWLKETLADSITLKQLYPDSYYGQEIISLASKQKTPVVFSPWNSVWLGPRNVDIVEKRIRTALKNGCDGFQFYECAAVVQATIDGRIVMQQPELRKLFKKYFLS